jgi:hypothetical protein
MHITGAKFLTLRTCAALFGGETFSSKWIISEGYLQFNMVWGTPFYFGQIIGYLMGALDQSNSDFRIYFHMS